MKWLERDYRSNMERIGVPPELTENTLRQMRKEEGKNKRAYKITHWVAAVSAAVAIVVSVLAGTLLKGEPPLYKQHLSPGLSNVGKTLQNDNLKVTVKGVSGDFNQLYLTYEIEFVDGSPLQENSVFRKSLIGRTSFELAQLTCEGQSYDVTSFRTDNGEDPARLCFEGIVSPRGKNLSGKEATLTLKNLKDEVEVCRDAGFQFDNLNALWKQMAPEEDDQLAKTGDYIVYGDGSAVPSYMIKAGSRHVAFSEQFPSFYIDNIGLQVSGEKSQQVKWLYVSITPGNEREAKELQSLYFQRISDAKVMDSQDICGGGHFRGGDFKNTRYDTQEYKDKIAMQDGRVILALAVYDREVERSIPRDITLNDLTDYRLVRDSWIEEVLRSEGSWKINFVLDYQSKEKQ